MASASATGGARPLRPRLTRFLRLRAGVEAIVKNAAAVSALVDERSAKLEKRGQGKVSTASLLASQEFGLSFRVGAGKRQRPGSHGARGDGGGGGGGGGGRGGGGGGPLVDLGLGPSLVSRYRGRRPPVPGAAQRSSVPMFDGGAVEESKAGGEESKVQAREHDGTSSSSSSTTSAFWLISECSAFLAKESTSAFTPAQLTRNLFGILSSDKPTENLQEDFLSAIGFSEAAFGLASALLSRRDEIVAAVTERELVELDSASAAALDRERREAEDSALAAALAAEGGGVAGTDDVGGGSRDEGSGDGSVMDWLNSMRSGAVGGISKKLLPPGTERTHDAKRKYVLGLAGLGWVLSCDVSCALCDLTPPPPPPATPLPSLPFSQHTPHTTHGQVRGGHDPSTDPAPSSRRRRQPSQAHRHRGRVPGMGTARVSWDGESQPYAKHGL